MVGCHSMIFHIQIYTDTMKNCPAQIQRNIDWRRTIQTNIFSENKTLPNEVKIVKFIYFVALSLINLILRSINC